MSGAFEDRFEDRVGTLGEDSHLEMAFEDQVADPLLNSPDYNQYWQDGTAEEALELGFEDDEDALYEEVE